MDPNANLKDQLELCGEIRTLLEQIGAELEKGPDCDTHSLGLELAHQATELVDLVVSLDDWLRRGGFLPRRWKDPQV